MKKITLLFSILSYISFGQIPYQVKDIFPGTITSGVYLNERPFSYNNGILFNGNDQTNYEQLWYSDGTAAGTYMLKNCGSPGNFFKYGSKVLFTGTLGGGIWITDGTTIGTYSISQYGPYWLGLPFTNINNIVYCSTNSPSIGTELARTDGTSGGSFVLKDIWPGTGSSNPAQLTDAGSGNFYFVANNSVNGEELWKSDGTSSGTQMVKDILPGTGSSQVLIVGYTNNILFFTANDGVNGRELWRSDGTLGGTYLLKDLNPGSGNCIFGGQIIHNNKLFFPYNGNVIWESDGTISGTFSSPNLFTVTNISMSNLYVHNNNIYFISGKLGSLSNIDSLFFYKITSSISNISIYKKIKLSNLIPDVERILIFQSDNNKFLFRGGSTILISHLLGMSDGTQLGTSILSYDGVSESIPGLYMANRMPFLNNEWYMPLNTTSNGLQIHRVNSNTGAITLTKNIGSNFVGTAWSWYFNYAILNNKLYFIANDLTTGNELWVTDGTSSGTFLTLDIYPGINNCIGNNDYLFRPATTNNKLFFVANDGITGNELWSLTDGMAGFKEIKLDKSLSVFPNPTSGELNIKSNSNNNSKLEIVNCLGQTVLTQNYSDNIDVSRLVPGYYFIRIDNAYSKFVKE